MSQPPFLADHDLNEHIVQGVLRHESAIEFIRARNVGMDERSDAEVLEDAAKNQLLVVSHDVNTMPDAAYARMRAGIPVAGLLLVKQSDPEGMVIKDLLRIWSASEGETPRGRTLFLAIAVRSVPRVLRVAPTPCCPK